MLFGELKIVEEVPQNHFLTARPMVLHNFSLCYDLLGKTALKRKEAILEGAIWR